MQEIEVKILNVNRPEVEKKLKEIGAEKEFECELYAIVFDQENGELRNSGRLLRLRKEQDGTKLTFKKTLKSSGAKVMEETETTVQDFEAMRMILRELGYEESLTLRKIRCQYAWEGNHILFDQYLDNLGHVPEFLEIEAKSEAELPRILEKLGLDPADALPWSTKDLIREFGLR